MRIITVNLRDIKENASRRIDPKYHVITETFKQMKQRGFIITSFEQCAQEITSGNYVKTYVPATVEKSIPYLRVKTIRPFFLNENKQDLVYTVNNLPKKMITKTNDIVVGRTAVQGIASLIDDKYQGAAISQHVTRIQLKKHVSPEFALAFMNSRLFKLQMANASYGSTRTELTHTQFKNLKFVLPPKAFEDKIQTLVRKAITKHRESMNLITQAQELFYQISKLNPSSMEPKQFFSTNLHTIKDGIWTPRYAQPAYLHVLKEIKKKVRTIRLGDIASIQKGNEVGRAYYRRFLDKNPTDLPFIRTSDLVNYEIDEFPDYFVSEKKYHELNQDIRPNDILFNNEGKIGVVAMLTKHDKIIIQSHIRRIRIHETMKDEFGITQEYLFLILTLQNIIGPQLQRFKVVQSTIATIGNKLGLVEIPILDEEFITQLSSLVSLAFRLKNEKKSIIKKILNLMDQYLETPGSNNV